jgi:hypothetical protein
MKVRYAAGFSAIIVLASLLFSLALMRPGLPLIGVILRRQAWLIESTPLWNAGLWLWLLAIFSWMVVLVVLAWSYLPGHRIASMLQSGLMLISAVLTIGGVVTWMNVLPFAAAQDDAATWISLVDRLALGLLGAGLFMGGAVTAWITIDIIRLQLASPYWWAPGTAAGILLIPAPFLLPQSWFLVAAALIWVGWLIFLASRRSIPYAYTEWR